MKFCDFLKNFEDIGFDSELEIEFKVGGLAFGDSTAEIFISDKIEIVVYPNVADV